MKKSDLEELETLYIFTPSPGDTWGLTFTHLKQHLLEADPEAFIRVEDPRDGNSLGNSFMFFEFTLEGKEIEGMSKIAPEGVAAQNCTARQAADFVKWLRTSVAPSGHNITFNTEWGLESEIPDTDVPIAEKSELTDLFLAHIVETGGLEQPGSPGGS
ncbi:hypothetical protein [Streptomyces sp. NPDC048462]|uniref:hypothetical protein n=1 Tax=Streptomyces sp. NPDC048462 TaxID=3365555 RepID=UPI003723E7FE